MYPVESQPGTVSSPLRRAWRLLRAPVLGVALGLALVKGYDRWRIARMTPLERRDTARGHCDRALEIQDEACKRLNLPPIRLPEDVLDAMIAEYSRALEVDPGNLEALQGRAYWRARRDDPGGAMRDYDELIERSPGDWLALYQRAGMRCDAGNHLGAIDDYSRSLAIKPFHVGSAVLGARARCRMHVRDFRGALADYQAEGGYDAWPIGDCHAALGEHAEAVAAFDTYLKRSDAPLALYRRGLSRFCIGDRAGALEDFKRACQGENEARTEAVKRIDQSPSDPVCELLREALLPMPERPR